MNEVLSTINKRRSTRGFTNEQIPEDDIKKILKAGLEAPTALNQQNWHFTVVRNKDLILQCNEEVKKYLNDEMRQRMLDRFNGDESFNIYYNAPTLVFIFGEEDSPYSSLNCSFACQNIALSAESLGYNSCNIGLSALLFNNENYYDILQAPKGYKIVNIIALGNGAVTMPLPEKDMNKVTYLN